ARALGRRVGRGTAGAGGSPTRTGGGPLPRGGPVDDGSGGACGAPARRRRRRLPRRAGDDQRRARGREGPHRPRAPIRPRRARGRPSGPVRRTTRAVGRGSRGGRRDGALVGARRGRRGPGQVPGVFAAGELRDVWLRGIIEDRLCGCGNTFRTCETWRAIGEAAFGGWEALDVEEVASLRRRLDRPWMIPRILGSKLTPELDA